MTTIIAVERDGSVQFGFDSKASGLDQIQLEQPKVFTNSGVVYGVAGLAAFINELQYADMPEAPGDDVDVDRWVTRELTPAIKSVAETTMKPNDDGEYECGLLIQVGKRVYEFGGNLGWVRSISGRYAIGSGFAFAMGALSAGATVKEALEIAALHDSGTGFELRVVSHG